MKLMRKGLRLICFIFSAMLYMRTDVLAEPIKVSVFGIGPTDLREGGYASNEMIRKLGELFELELEFVHPEWGTASEQLNEMLISGDYPDLIYLPSNSDIAGNEELYADAGLFMDLTDIIETSMPNYRALLDEIPEIRNAAYTESGRIVGLLKLSYNALEHKVERQPNVGGMMIRDDWLTIAGLRIPETYDDWEEMLTVFKEKFGAVQPLYLPPEGYWSMNPGYFCSGFGVIAGMQKLGDHVVYGPVTEGWKQYAELMHRWYKKGLIGAEYLNNSNYGIDKAAFTGGKTGAMVSVWTFLSEFQSASDRSARFRAVNSPVLQSGVPSQDGFDYMEIGWIGLLLNSKLSGEKLDRILKLLDYLYSEEGAFLAAYGEENDTWLYDENGEVILSDKILSNSAGDPPDVAVDHLLMPVNELLMKDWSREQLMKGEAEQKLTTVWNQVENDLFLPELRMTVEEQEEFDSIMLYVEAYMQESLTRMIMGESEVGDLWDSYLENMERLGVHRAEELKQQAYDRMRFSSVECES